MSDENYRVIEILDEYSIIINYGKEDGAVENDDIRIISTGPEVIDPETRNVLGTLDLVKAKLTITTAYEKFSLCQHIVSSSRNALLSPFSQFQTTTREVKELKVDEKSISRKQAPSDKIIKRGDLVEIL